MARKPHAPAAPEAGRRAWSAAAAVTRLSWLAVLVAGCAERAPPPLLGGAVREQVPMSLPSPQHELEVRRARVVARARQLVNGAPFASGELTFGSDPVGFVRAAFWAARIDLFDPAVAGDTGAGGVEILFRSAAAGDGLHKQTPRSGDLVFFDAARSGLYPSHVALVEETLEGGTVLLLGYFDSGPARAAMNLRTPELATDTSGVVVNDVVGGRPLAQLFRCFADPF